MKWNSQKMPFGIKFKNIKEKWKKRIRLNPKKKKRKQKEDKAKFVN